MKKVLSLFLMIGILFTTNISLAEDVAVPKIDYMSHINNSTLDKGTTVTVKVVESESLLLDVSYGWKNVATDSYIAPQEVKSNLYSNTYTIVTNAPTDAGTYLLAIRARNILGEYQWFIFTYTVKADTIVSDTTGPIVTLSHPDGLALDTNELVYAYIKDDETQITYAEYGWKDLDTNKYIYQKKFDINSNSGTLIDNAPTSAGSYRFAVRAYNAAGLVSSWATADYKVGISTVPTTCSHTYGSWIVSGDYHYRVCSKCNTTSDYATHTYVNNVCTVCGAVKTSVHTHTLSGWQINSNNHWKACTGCSTTFDYSAHTFVNNVCTVCGYSKATASDNASEIEVSPDSGSTLEYGDKVTIEASDKDGVDYIEYYWNDDDDDTYKAYKEEVTTKVPSEEGKNYLYVRVKDELGNLSDYERFTYYIEENYYPGDADGDGDLNSKVKELRVEIGNYEDRLIYEPDEEIKYYINYYNGTSSKVSSVKIEVELPDYFKGVSASDNGTIKSGKIVWNLGTLAAKEDGRLTFKVRCTTEKYNEMKFEMPVKIYQSSKEKDSSFTVNMIYNEDVDKTGTHEAYCTGYPDGTFRPEGQITRAELASMIANMLGYEQGSYYRNGFADVSSDHWAAGYIQFCVDNGYMSGYSYNTFAPSQPATRAMLADAIAKVLEVDDIEPIYLKANDTKNHPAGNSMEQLIRLNYIEGYSNGSSGINNYITRAEAVTIINKYLFRGELDVNNSSYYYGNYYNNGYYGNYYGNYYNNGYYYNYYNQVPQFRDLYTSHWAYGHIMEATCNHRYQRVVAGNEEMVD